MSEARQSNAFERLHERMQRWIWKQGWSALRPVQEHAAEALLEGERDVLISAATAGGKTEAAFLPLVSNLLFDRDAHDELGLVLYIAPLKALINDQLDRLELMTDGLDVPITPWHGDIPARAKRAFRNRPEGVLLITPESLEALFVNHGQVLSQLFGRLRHIVIDELHAFIGEERGMQLQSLLHRLELARRQRAPRLALSATLGDLDLAASFLRPGAGAEVIRLTSSDTSQELKVQLRGYEQKAPSTNDHGGGLSVGECREGDEQAVTPGDASAISEDLFRVLRGTSNLIFANSRANVEFYADLLGRAAERLKVPNEFFPHHGSLSKGLREYTEAALKERRRPVNAVCTSTLEMGIDIGAVESVAQIGAPYAVSSLRQRLGRSGRRGSAAVLRLYVREPEWTPQTPLQDRLRVQLFQAAAMIERLIEGWIEPPAAGALHLSTGIQQILSVIAERGGASAQGLWNVLCEGTFAPFASVGKEDFVRLLRRMGEAELLTQSAEGLLLHGSIGERVVNHYSFYAAFTTPEEYTLACEGKILGQIPIDRPVDEGSYLIFAGKRWQVMRVDPERKCIDLNRSAGGIPPKFGGEGGRVHQGVHTMMRTLYERPQPPRYLDTVGRTLFEQGRQAFQEAGLDERGLVEDGQDTLAFPWCGDAVLDTLMFLLRAEGLDVEHEGVALVAFRTPARQLREALRRIVDRPAPSGAKLAERVENKVAEKYDHFLDEQLLSRDYAARRLDIPGALGACEQLLEAR